MDWVERSWWPACTRAPKRLPHFRGGLDAHPALAASCGRRYNLAYVHCVEPRVAGSGDLPADQVKDSLEPFRKASFTVFLVHFFHGFAARTNVRVAGALPQG